MKRQLRSNYEKGTSLWAVRRAQWRALGLTDEDMEKPKIAVVNTSSELAICFSHLDGVAKIVKEAIREAGGLPFEIRTAAPSDFIHSAGHAGNYILPSRDLITNDIEVQVEGAKLDGMICLTSCDKTVPGHLMAAARLNIPTLLVIGGYQPSGVYRNHHVDIEEVFLGAGHHVAGKLSYDDLLGMSENAIGGPGVCSGMGTANSMHIVTEALGMSLPGAAPVMANSKRMMDFAKRSGRRIVEMVGENLLPRAIMTPDAFANAAMAVLAVSGSINCIKHLQATALEAGLPLDFYKLFDEISDKVPVLSAVRPIGESSIEAFEAAGGALAVLKQLEPMLRTGALTVSGKTVAENLREVKVEDTETIRPLARPLSDKASIVIVRGSLAPDGGIAKLGLRRDKILTFTGRARCFATADAAMAALKEKKIVPGDVIVLRGLGVRGGPGMGMASRVVFALDGAGLGADVAFVTDGQLSGLVNKGLVVGEVTPEAAVGGPIRLIEDGDRIAIDAEAKTIMLDVPEAELAARRAKFVQKDQHSEEGWLAIYERSVQPLSRGAALVRPK
ncbi:MAG TPA: dihydroxy-acid dehydratase [Xanthobacteraceae bacterium]|nr:dihydroxy-acid dehydratase [Xanthobacteraceae bacterium]